MSRHRIQRPTRQELLDTLNLTLSRQVSTRTILMHAAMADCLGLNHADHKALDLIYEAERDGKLMTAGQLAEQSGLTTGSVTSLVDRLEKANFVRRIADPHDRRKVVLEPTHARDLELGALFMPLAAAAAELSARYTDAELEVIVDYMRRSIALVEQETHRLRALAAERAAK